MPFPNVVNAVAGVAFPGDFASDNPRASLLGGMGQFVAAAAGVTVGHFCWIPAAVPEGNTLTGVGTGNGKVAGFVHREMNALIATYLAEGTMVILGGLPVTAMVSGDYWAQNLGGTTAANRWSTVWARLTDGAVGVSATGTGADLTGGAAAWVETVWVTQSEAYVANGLVKIGGSLRL